MAIDTTVLAADLNAVIADMPKTARFPAATGTEFSCEATELTTEETLVLVGDVPKKAVRIIFPASAFTVTSAFKPQARLQLKFPDPANYTNYEIVSIMTTQDGIAYEVTLKADNRA